MRTATKGAYTCEREKGAATATRGRVRVCVCARVCVCVCATHTVRVSLSSFYLTPLVTSAGTIVRPGSSEPRIFLPLATSCSSVLHRHCQCVRVCVCVCALSLSGCTQCQRGRQMWLCTQGDATHPHACSDKVALRPQLLHHTPTCSVQSILPRSLLSQDAYEVPVR